MVQTKDRALDVQLEDVEGVLPRGFEFPPITSTRVTSPSILLRDQGQEVLLQDLHQPTGEGD